MRSEDVKDVMVYVIMGIVITTFIICTAISAISENNSKERIRDIEIQLEMMQLEYKKPAEPEVKTWPLRLPELLPGLNDEE